MIKKTWLIWADRLYQWRLSEVVASVLEAAGPLSFFGAQIIYLAQPLFTALTSPEKTQIMAELFESPTQQQACIEVLRRYPLEKNLEDLPRDNT